MNQGPLAISIHVPIMRKSYCCFSMSCLREGEFINDIGALR
jgi:hypothetical protein